MGQFNILGMQDVYGLVQAVRLVYKYISPF